MADTFYQAFLNRCYEDVLQILKRRRKVSCQEIRALVKGHLFNKKMDRTFVDDRRTLSGQAYDHGWALAETRVPDSPELPSTIEVE